MAVDSNLQRFYLFVCFYLETNMYLLPYRKIQIQILVSEISDYSPRRGKNNAPSLMIDSEKTNDGPLSSAPGHIHEMPEAAVSSGKSSNEPLHDAFCFVHS